MPQSCTEKYLSPPCRAKSCSCVKTQHNSAQSNRLFLPLSRHHLTQNWTANVTEADSNSCWAPAVPILCDTSARLRLVFVYQQTGVNNAPLNLFVWQTGEKWVSLPLTESPSDWWLRLQDLRLALCPIHPCPALHSSREVQLCPDLGTNKSQEDISAPCPLKRRRNKRVRKFSDTREKWWFWDKPTKWQKNP